METPNADRFMALLNREYEDLLTDAYKRLDYLKRDLELYANTPYHKWMVKKDIALTLKDIEYYSRGAENGETIPTAEPAETPGTKKYVITTEDMCVLGM